ncbi:MAG: hypothetical protein AB7P34_13365, partial [Vicinamibacterales bacterium]
RVLIQSIAPLVAAALAISISHDQVATIDGTARTSRESLYAVLDALLSHRSRGQGRTHPEAVSIILITATAHSERKLETLQRSLLSDLGADPRESVSVVRLSANEALVVAPMRMLTNMGLDPLGVHKTGRGREIKLTEIANSLQLREVLGLTLPAEPHETVKPIVH